MMTTSTTARRSDAPFVVEGLSNRTVYIARIQTVLEEMRSKGASTRLFVEQMSEDSTQSVRSIDWATLHKLSVSSFSIDTIEHACARLSSFQQYEEDWDGEGGKKPNAALITAAMTFVRRLEPWHPSPTATLDAKGRPVIEFHDDDSKIFGKVRFLDTQLVEIFAMSPNDEGALIEEPLESDKSRRFLSDELQITLRR